MQGCGSGSGLDPDSIGSVDPDPGIRIRIQEGKNDPQKQKFVLKVHVLKCWIIGWPFLRAEGFFCNLDILVLYGGLGIGKLQFDQKIFYFFSAVISIFGH
jgi:hypothetical protein